MLIHTKINKSLAYIQFYWNFPLDSFSFNKLEKNYKQLVKVFEKLQLFVAVGLLDFYLRKL